MKELLTHIVRELVDTPDQVEIKEVSGAKSTIFEIKVAKGDLGKIIGKEGRMAKSIRTIMTAVGMRNGIKVQVENIEH